MIGLLICIENSKRIPDEFQAPQEGVSWKQHCRNKMCATEEEAALEKQDKSNLKMEKEIFRENCGAYSILDHSDGQGADSADPSSVLDAVSPANAAISPSDTELPST